MNLYKKLNNQEIKLLKEVNIVVEDKEYLNKEREFIIYKIVEHMASFSKHDTSDIIKEYENIIYKIKND